MMPEKARRDGSLFWGRWRDKVVAVSGWRVSGIRAMPLVSKYGRIARLDTMSGSAYNPRNLRGAQ